MKLIISILVMFFFTVASANGQISPQNNFIGVDISTLPQDAAFDYDSCFALVTKLGMGTTGIFQNWSSIEPTPNAFNMIVFDIANYYYPLHNMPIDLTIAPIQTNNLEVPSDLTATQFDDSAFINRFEMLLDSIKQHIPDVTLNSLVIGSESDVYMGPNTALWDQFTTFYNAVSAYAKNLWPGLKVASELTFDGIVQYGSLAQTLNANSDYIGVSYYPLNNDFTVRPVSTVPTDFSTLVELYPSTPICFYQFGYPSSTSCNSSESQQAQFIAQTFTSWDDYASNIKMIDFTWLHDLDTATVNYYEIYYGISNAIFLEYIRTLGLRTWYGNGTDKLAFKELQCQAKQRGYNNLQVNCTTGITENTVDRNLVMVFPNPANGHLTIQTLYDFKKFKVTIFNISGRKVYENINKNVIEINSLHPSTYFLRVIMDDKVETSKIIIY